MFEARPSPPPRQLTHSNVLQRLQLALQGRSAASGPRFGLRAHKQRRMLQGAHGSTRPARTIWTLHHVLVNAPALYRAHNNTTARAGTGTGAGTGSTSRLVVTVKLFHFANVITIAVTGLVVMVQRRYITVIVIYHSAGCSWWHLVHHLQLRSQAKPTGRLQCQQSLLSEYVFPLSSKCHWNPPALQTLVG